MLDQVNSKPSFSLIPNKYSETVRNLLGPFNLSITLCHARSLIIDFGLEPIKYLVCVLNVSKRVLIKSLEVLHYGLAKLSRILIDLLNLRAEQDTPTRKYM